MPSDDNPPRNASSREMPYLRNAVLLLGFVVLVVVAVVTVLIPELEDAPEDAPPGRSPRGEAPAQASSEH